MHAHRSSPLSLSGASKQAYVVQQQPMAQPGYAPIYSPQQQQMFVQQQPMYAQQQQPMYVQQPPVAASPVAQSPGHVISNGNDNSSSAAASSGPSIPESAPERCCEALCCLCYKFWDCLWETCSDKELNKRQDL